MKEIKFGSLKVENEIKFGQLKIDFQKIYPELEDLEVTPTGEEQNFKSSKYGYNNVKVKGTENIVEDLSIELEEQDTLIKSQQKVLEQIYEILKIKLGESLTTEQIEAINNMTVAIENGELTLNYDEQVLDIQFILENGELTVDNNVNGLDFNINENGELEAIY